MLTSEVFFAQTIKADPAELKFIHTQKELKGLILKPYNGTFLRFKVYGRKYIQSTFIMQNKRISVRLYVYFNMFDKKLSPAVSLRVRI
jgi:hypothetical protein